MAKTSEFAGRQTGTILEITGLRNTWERDKIEGLRSQLAELLSPFNKPTDFEVILYVPGSEALSGPVTQLPPKEADLELDFRVLAGGHVSRKLSAAALDSKGEPGVLSVAKADTSPLIGLTGRFLYFLKRPSKTKTMGLTPAVRIYRDGVHLEPFGSPTADWLGISEKRAKRAGHAHMSSLRLYGFVEISRIKHQDLKDTSGRHALIDNDAARGLVTLLGEQLHFLEDNVRIRVTEPKWKVTRRKKFVERERASSFPWNALGWPWDELPETLGTDGTLDTELMQMVAALQLARVSTLGDHAREESLWVTVNPAKAEARRRDGDAAIAENVILPCCFTDSNPP